MFYENKTKVLKTNRKTLKYDLFSQNKNDEIDDFAKKSNDAKIVYNFSTSNGCLENGYGFSTFKAPTSFDNLKDEEEVVLVGDEISAVWSFKWQNKVDDVNMYFCMYYSGGTNFYYDDILGERPLPLIIPTKFTSTPVACSYRLDGQDVMVFSGEGSDLQVVGAHFNRTVPNAPKLMSICTHYDKLFAITSGARGSLVYTEDLAILEWDAAKTKKLDFNDDRGNLNKIISLNDYIYLFRDFGITKVSNYSTKNDFSISHLYQADGYIYPGSIAHGGDKIYFLERSGLKVFNGSSTKHIPLACQKLLSSCENLKACGVSYEGKYYLALRIDFADGEKVGCEKGEFVNNALFVYDENTGDVELTRGVDIRGLTVLNNPYKSKLVAYFYNDNKGKIGQLEKNGMCFDEALPKLWKSVKTDFGRAETCKKVTKIHLCSKFDCTVTIKSDMEEKTLQVSGSDKLQTISTSVFGQTFEVAIAAEGAAKISNFQIEYLERS